MSDPIEWTARPVSRTTRCAGCASEPALASPGARGFRGSGWKGREKSRIQEGLSSAGSGSVAAGVRASSELSLIKVGGFVVVRMG